MGVKRGTKTKYLRPFLKPMSARRLLVVVLVGGHHDVVALYAALCVVPVNIDDDEEDEAGEEADKYRLKIIHGGSLVLALHMGARVCSNLPARHVVMMAIIMLPLWPDLAGPVALSMCGQPSF